MAAAIGVPVRFVRAALVLLAAFIVPIALPGPVQASASATPAWGIVASPNTSATQNNFLLSVSCVSASDCWAVGEYRPDNTTFRTLIEHWDGDSWTLVTSPNAGPATAANQLVGVTCVSATDCWAVGQYRDGNVLQTLTERWDGATWVIIPSPNANTPPQDNYFDAVSCVSATDCWAVGEYISCSFPCVDVALLTLIEHWDGMAWAIVPSPNALPLSVANNDLLFGVTCVSASDCWAVGYSSGPRNFDTLIERWDGTKWDIVPSPNPLAADVNWLYGVTCVSASDCWSVGTSYDSVTKTTQTLTERWDGASWVLVPSSSSSATQAPTLRSVTCVSTSDCWSVGDSFDVSSSIYQTLIEHWDGISWGIVASPDTSSAQTNSLDGVSCVSASDCWAVGFGGVGGTLQTLTADYTAHPSGAV